MYLKNLPESDGCDELGFTPADALSLFSYRQVTYLFSTGFWFCKGQSHTGEGKQGWRADDSALLLVQGKPANASRELHSALQTAVAASSPDQAAPGSCLMFN